ncbi:MAG: N-acetylglucosamine kinase [Lentihominibacter sp.]
MKYYLGIDGGGTKTKFTLCDESLNKVSEYTGPGCHYLQVGFDGLQEVISSGLRKVTAGGRHIETKDIAFAFAGCAGYGDVAADAPLIGDAIKKGLGGIPSRVGNDCENALAGALGDTPGINIIAGTGSVGCGRNSRGDFARCGGWHHVMGGDEGSGYWISWSLLKEFQRQSDGRDARTLLYEEVRRALELNTDDEIVTRVVGQWNLDRTKIASLAPLALELCNAGDPHGKAILKEAAVQLADFAFALYDRLGFDRSEIVPCSGTGGVFRMGSPVTEPFSELLASKGMEYKEPMSEPDMGAVMLAMKFANQKE